MVRWVLRLALACLLLSASASSSTSDSSAGSQPLNRLDLSSAKWRRSLFAQVAIPSSADPVVGSSDTESDDQHASEESAEDEEEESADDEEECNLQQNDMDLCVCAALPGCWFQAAGIGARLHSVCCSQVSVCEIQ